MIRNPRVRPASRRNPGAGAATIYLAVVWLLCGLLPGSASAEELHWSFKPGEVLHYSYEDKIVTSMKHMGQERKMNQAQSEDITWTIKSVAAGGDAEVTLRYDRIRMRREMPPFMPFEFDSNDSSAPAPPGFEAEIQMLKARVGSEVSFTMKPTGEIANIKIPEATLKRLREAAPKEAGDQEISEAGLKEMLAQSSPQVFPAGPLDPGKSWSKKLPKLSLGPATMEVESTFTFQGPDPKVPTHLLVGMETKVAFQPAEGVTIQVRKQEGKGSLTFDAAAGHLASSRISQKLDLSMTHMGQTIEQTSDKSQTVTLRP